MNIIKKHWKNASSLIMIAKDTLKNNKNWSALLLERSSRSKFMPNAYVFPGGITEHSDYSKKWWKLFEKKGWTRKKLADIFFVKGERPPLIQDIDLEHDSMPPDIALRITAIREAFEEVGILLHDGNKKLENSDINFVKWRNYVYNDPHEFINLFEELDCLPNIWNLYEWSNWLTPSDFKPRRYDTMFYIYCCKDGIPVPIACTKEVEYVQVCRLCAVFIYFLDSHFISRNFYFVTCKQILGVSDSPPSPM